jgi:hypothetical protein
MTTIPSYGSITSEDSWMELNEDIIDRTTQRLLGMKFEVEERRWYHG